MSRVKNYAIYADAYRHGKYDFGSWSELFKKIGWKNVAKYERLILVNDSCYGPFYDIEKLCTTDFDKSQYDILGYTENKNKSKNRRHIQSFFFVFKKNVFTNKKFQKFFENVEHLQSKDDILIKYEKGLSQLLMKLGFKYTTFIKNATAYYPNKIMKQNGFLLKTSFFTRTQPDESLLCFKGFEKRYPDYNENLITNHAKRMGVDVDDMIKKSILIIRNYKSVDDLKFLLGKYKIFTPFVYIALNIERIIFLSFRKTIFKLFRSIRKRIKRLFN